jgi:putative inorganic carbon (HCO3(-)) transporter
MWRAETFARYLPGAGVHDAHSIYFKVLGEHGWIGLILFCAIGLMVWRSAGRVANEAARRPDQAELGALARMIQVSLAAFAVGGAFLGLSYFDLYWHLVAVVVICRSLMGSEIAERAAAGEPARNRSSLQSNA